MKCIELLALVSKLTAMVVSMWLVLVAGVSVELVAEEVVFKDDKGP